MKTRFVDRATLSQAPLAPRLAFGTGTHWQPTLAPGTRHRAPLLVACGAEQSFSASLAEAVQRLPASLFGCREDRLKS